MDREKTVFDSFMGMTSIVFTLAILANVIVGWAVKSHVEDQQFEGAMKLIGQGLSYELLIQLLLFAVLITALDRVFDRFTKKILMMWQILLRLSIYVLMAVTFIVVFRWIPLNEPFGWIAFIIVYCVFCGGGMVFMVIKTRMDDKKYSRQLSEYKKKHNVNETEEFKETERNRLL